jgi:hypothetical protein
MKQKEEKLLQAQRTRTLINVEGQHLLRLVNALDSYTVKFLVTSFLSHTRPSLFPRKSTL